MNLGCEILTTPQNFKLQALKLVSKLHAQAPGALAVPEELAADVYERGQAFHARPSGLDAVEFLLAAGPAEPLRPLVRCVRVCSATRVRGLCGTDAV